MPASRHEFLDALLSGDVRRVRELLDAEPDLLRVHGETGESPVLAALYHGRREVLELLLERHDDLDLFEAAALGRTGRVREILDEGLATIGMLSHDGWTALHLAAFFGHLEGVRLLLDRGADLAARSTNVAFGAGNTPLHAAVAGGRLEVARLLLERGADANAADAARHTPLHLAAGSPDPALAELLLEGGAERERRTTSGETPLAIAERLGRERTAAVLRTRAAG